MKGPHQHISSLSGFLLPCFTLPLRLIPLSLIPTLFFLRQLALSPLFKLLCFLPSLIYFAFIFFCAVLIASLLLATLQHLKTLSSLLSSLLPPPSSSPTTLPSLHSTLTSRTSALLNHPTLSSTPAALRLFLRLVLKAAVFFLYRFLSSKLAHLPRKRHGSHPTFSTGVLIAALGDGLVAAALSPIRNSLRVALAAVIVVGVFLSGVPIWIAARWT